MDNPPTMDGHQRIDYGLDHGYNDDKRAITGHGTGRHVSPVSISTERIRSIHIDAAFLVPATSATAIPRARSYNTGHHCPERTRRHDVPICTSSHPGPRLFSLAVNCTDSTKLPTTAATATTRSSNTTRSSLFTKSSPTSASAFISTSSIPYTIVQSHRTRHVFMVFSVHGVWGLQIRNPRMGSKFWLLL